MYCIAGPKVGPARKAVTEWELERESIGRLQSLSMRQETHNQTFAFNRVWGVVLAVETALLISLLDVRSAHDWPPPHDFPWLEKEPFIGFASRNSCRHCCLFRRTVVGCCLTRHGLYGNAQKQTQNKFDDQLRRNLKQKLQASVKTLYSSKKLLFKEWGLCCYN